MLLILRVFRPDLFHSIFTEIDFSVSVGVDLFFAYFSNKGLRLMEKLEGGGIGGDTGLGSTIEGTLKESP